MFPAGAHTLNACLFCGAYGSISESTRRRVTGCMSSKILLISFQRRRSSLAEATPSERVKSTYFFYHLKYSRLTEELNPPSTGFYQMNRGCEMEMLRFNTSIKMSTPPQSAAVIKKPFAAC